MLSISTLIRLVIVVLAVVVIAAGCGTTNGRPALTHSAATIADENGLIRPVVEKLAVNFRELRVVYDDLHIAARDALSGERPDRQLDYIQKVYLHVNTALMVAESQYQMLSVIHYVSDDRRTDYLTLRSRGLDRARARMEDAIEFIGLYDAFIRNSKATEAISRARALIQGNIYLYSRLLDILEPLVHPAGAFTPDPYAPI